LKTDSKSDQQKALDYLESVSGEIQLLALNIAVAAAKLAHNNKIGIEVNQNLSNLVNQATLAVKQMNLLVDAARTENSTRKILADLKTERVDEKLTEKMESVMNEIIRDSEKIVRLLSDAKKG
jgi:hypothetical protein